MNARFPTCAECGHLVTDHAFGCSLTPPSRIENEVLSGCTVRAEVQKEHAARWTVTNAGWVQNEEGRPVAKVFGAGVDNPMLRIQAARVSALIVNAPEAIDVIRGLMTANLRDTASTATAINNARAWLRLALVDEREIP